MLAEPILQAEGLSVTIALGEGTLNAVRDVSLTLQRGETLGIVGESGCGKSLTSLALMGLLPKKAVRTARKLTYADCNLLTVKDDAMSDLRGNRLAMIFQEPMTSLNPVYTIGNQLTEVARRHQRLTQRQARDRAIYLLEKVGISAAAERLNQFPHQLSGGLRQRIMIAMALMCSPDVLIADEPTTALDVTIQAQILNLLRELQRDLKMGMILITHDLGVVARVADRVAVMYAGEVVETGTTAEVFSRPLHPYTQGLLRCIPIPGKTPAGKPLGVMAGTVPSLLGEISGCSFRNRCSYATQPCSQRQIALVETAQHAYRCVLSESTSLENYAREVR